MPKGVYARPVRVADCHPDRKHYSKGMCRSCYWIAYYIERPEQREKNLERSRRRHASPAQQELERARRSDPAYQARSSEYHRRYYQKNRDRFRVAHQEYRRRLRQEMIEAYGGACSCCGESELAFLSLEHLNGDGKAHRLQFGERGNNDGVVRDLKRRGWPKDGYTILCFNCNMGKAVNGGICPHQAGLLRLVAS